MFRLKSEHSRQEQCGRLTARWSGLMIQRQIQEMIEIAFLEKNVRKRIPAAHLCLRPPGLTARTGKHRQLAAVSQQLKSQFNCRR